MGQIAVDTTFLIDFEREAGAVDGPVARFLADHGSDQFYMCLTVLGEFAAGFTDLGDNDFQKVRSRFGLLSMDEGVALAYRLIYRDLREKGRLIGANDLWIAAAARRFQMPLVSRNLHEFQRVEGLQVLSY